MSRDATIGDWLTFFSGLSHYYRTLVLAPLWEDRFEDHPEDPWASLALFLYGYAFGRRGGSGYRGGVGAEALSRARRCGPYPQALDAAETTWDLLRDISPGEVPNPGGHPLYPSSDPLGLGVRPHPSLLEIRYVGDVTGHRASLTDFASSLLARGDSTTVFDLLTGVRGVGEGRAKSFLRDLAVWMDREPPDDGHLLEPADGRVRRSVSLLARDGPEDEEPGSWLLARCEDRGLKPHRVSAGMSYFEAEIAGDPYSLERCLGDLSVARRLEEEHRSRLSRAAAHGS